MTVQTTSNLSNSIRTQYIEKYLESAEFERLYDQLATPIGKDGVVDATFLGNSVQVNFLSDMQPGTTAISQTADINPQTLRDTTTTVTPTSRGEALQWSQEIDLKAYTNYGELRFSKLGKNQMESVELLAIAAALQGGNVFRGAARASLDAGTASHLFSHAALAEIETRLAVLKCPYYLPLAPSGKPTGGKSWVAIMHPEIFYDLRSQSDVESVAIYQDKEIVLNHELGQLGHFKLIVSPWAKVFGAAGADNASNVDTTLSSAANALATQIVVASATNITAGDYLTIGTEETGNTFQPVNERVRVSAAYTSGTTIDIIGEGDNGGLRFDHASAVSVRNADSVFPVAFGGPMSLCKVYANEVGEYGEVVGPIKTGLVEQFTSIGWKWYGQYGRWRENCIVRGEFASSLEA